jgi:hypothetical protein
VTVLLVVLCLLVGTLELYAGKRSKDQTDAFLRRIDELREQVDQQSGVLVTVGEQLKSELFKVQRDVLPAMETRVRQNTGQIEQLRALLQQAEAYLRGQAERLQDLEQQKITLAALRRKLTEIETSVEAMPRAGAAAPSEDVESAFTRIATLERNGDQIMELQRDLTKALEGVEDVVTDLLGFTSFELDRAVSTSLTGRPVPDAMVGGRLWSRDPSLEDVLVEVYERCVRANRMGIRFKATEGAPGQLRYFLTGRGPEELVGDFAALLVSIDREDVPTTGRRQTADAVALQALLRAFIESTGATAQIGPLVVLRTREELLCAVLSHAQVLEFENARLLDDSLAAAVWLRRLPAHQVRDLTAWAAQPREV